MTSKLKQPLSSCVVFEKSIKFLCYHVYVENKFSLIQWGAFYLLIADFLLHKIWVGLKSLWAYCELMATFNINMELKHRLAIQK